MMVGCSESSSTNIGVTTHSIYRNGWSIEIDVKGAAVSERETNNAYIVETAGHTIAVDNGVTLDGKPIVTGKTGMVEIKNHGGKFDLTVNGNEVKLN